MFTQSDHTLAAAYASLILADENIEITPDKLQTILKAAGIDIEPIWSMIMAKALYGKNVKEIVTTLGVKDPDNGGTAGAMKDTAEVIGEKNEGDEGVDCAGRINESDDEEGMFDLFG
ncbi:hypothetical protein EJ05DRAFT_477704 [Pseudovirgaria hyperparasitica]|uniref:Large ribosomal subunit protein P1 n=1 Tax=Pseudovirgaria hyperparasitica TaxID=470096 RepID=A0A6A6W0Z8_9PEZI|nr:uncharacterized protein EJ05DRAFT_477704 [Pseudovirgaria hyperparasitica]KAF2756588.1 hypothetical protein EJ05DRAFT_477704 [Pseudovirgaria hyperparasitica]